MTEGDIEEEEEEEDVEEDVEEEEEDGDGDGDEGYEYVAIKGEDAVIVLRIRGRLSSA